MNSPWKESGDATALTIEFDGVDVERRDARDVEAFKRALKTPEQEEEGVVVEPSPFTRGMGSFDILRFGLFIVLLALGALLGECVLAIGTFIAGAVGAHLPVIVQQLVFLVCLWAPSGVVAYRLWPRKAPPLPPNVRFGLELGEAGFSFSVTGEASRARSVPLEDIERFEGNHGIAVIMKSGLLEQFPCGLPMVVDQLALAARLNEALGIVRAATGERAAQTRVDLGERRAHIDADADADADANAAEAEPEANPVDDDVQRKRW